jgi:heme/copper-type cytochrome/quinol oxidase subunit 4
MIMTSLPKSVSVVWAVLMVATCTSTWWLSHDGVNARVGTAAILLIAAFKVRLVMLHFMELRNAPLWWRFVYETWLLVCTAVILAIYVS